MTNTNGPATATVETLTAQVQVLQVGSRQITLSVVKQLDRARYEDIEPMGRVRSSRKDTPHHGECSIEVVGRHRDTGVLVFGYAPWPHDPVPDEWLHWMDHARYQEIEPQWPCRKESFGDMLHYLHFAVIDRDGHRLEWPYQLRENVYQQEHCAVSVATPHDGERGEDGRRLREEWTQRRRCGEFCDMPALETAWHRMAREQHAASVHARKLRAEAEALPLIVLAGLR
jgi:hypothetical protein